VASGVATVPTDFKKLKSAYYNGTPISPLNWVSLDELYRRHPDRSVTTIPCLISREGANFVFGPVAIAGTAALKGTYYAKKAGLRDTDPSWYVTNAPEVLLYGSLLEAVPFIKDDPRISTWKDFFRESVQSLLDEEENSEISGGQLYQRAS